MAFVIKVSHANGLRRLTWRKEDVGSEGIPFAAIESRIRDVLQTPASAKVSMTYTDAEGDVVTMSNDLDVHDALFQQKLNPLRVTVTVDASAASSPAAAKKVEPASAPASAPAPVAVSATVIDNDVTIKQVLAKLSNPEIRKVLQSYEPLIEKVSSPTQATAFLESLLRNVSTQVAAVVKHGADVASSAANVATSAANVNPFAFSSGQTGLSSGASSATSISSRSSEAFNALVAEAEAKAEAAGKQKADVDNVVHSGVSCDMCEVHPIVGLRYKANKRYNYDLCSSCFEKHGKEEDFQKIEQSMFRPRHLHGSGPHRGPPPFHPFAPGFHGRPFGGMRGPPPFGRHHCHMPGGAAGGGKLDSRFVCDVTMFDGTEVAPSANFTKIWRLRNSGAFPWPVRTSLVHVGGDELGQVSMVPLEIPPQGLVPEGEMEVAVDMVAPEKPGRYVSHWRLASPTGPKFGHRIWAVIQVVANASPSEEGVPDDEGVEQADVVESSAKSFAPTVEEPVAVPAAEDTKGNESAAGEAEGESADDSVTSLVNVVMPTAAPLEENSVKDDVSDVQERDIAPETEIGEGYAMVDVESSENGEKIVETEQEKVNEVQEVSKHADEAEPVVNVNDSPITYPKLQVNEGPITYPVVQSEAPVSEGEQSAAAEVTGEESAAAEATAEGESLKTSMAKLQAMGFTNTKLNLELLAKNNLDLRMTLNDLCAVEEWDPILEELEEMGFYDVDVNRRLMFKNNGSVKRVVKELVQMYRNLQDKGRNAE